MKRNDWQAKAYMMDMTPDEMSWTPEEEAYWMAKGKQLDADRERAAAEKEASRAA